MCPQCGQGTAPGYAACPSCGASLLVDVLFPHPVADARARFELAKALWALGELHLTFPALQQTLEEPTPVVARRVTRALGERCVALAEARGARATIASSSGAALPSSPSGLRIALAGAALCLAAGAGAWLGWSRTSAPPPSPPASTLPVLTAGAREPPAAPPPKPTEVGQAAVERTLKATVAIRCPHTVGAGFFVAEDLVLTNDHVVCPDGELMKVILPDGRTVLGKTRHRDPWLDLATVEVSGARGDPLPLGDAAALRPGERIAAVGSPRGLEFSLNLGAVSYVGRNRFGVGYLQVDVSVNPGSSGGPVVDAAGNAVGVMAMMIKDSNGLGLAIPVNYAVTGAEAVLPKAAPSPGWTGLVSRVEAEDARQVDEARRSFLRPGLLGAVEAADGSLYGIVIRRFADQTPTFEPLHFRMEHGGVLLCPDTVATPSSWSEADRSPQGASDPRLFEWLKRHQLQQGLYVGAAEVRWRQCGPLAKGTELVLKDGEPTSDRARIVPASELAGAFVPPSAPPPQAPPAPEPSAPQRTAGPDEAQWRGRFRDARQRIQDVDTRVAQAKQLIGQADWAAHQGRRLTPDAAAEYDEAKKRIEGADEERRRAREALDELDRQASFNAVPREWRQ